MKILITKSKGADLLFFSKDEQVYYPFHSLSPINLPNLPSISIPYQLNNLSTTNPVWLENQRQIRLPEQKVLKRITKKKLTSLIENNLDTLSISELSQLLN